jgi:hypothetical protein
MSDRFTAPHCLAGDGSADRTGLDANCLLTGIFTGNFAIIVL